MGQAKRRRDAGEAKPDIKIAPRKLAQPVMVVHHSRRERTDDRGQVFAINYFQLVDPTTQKPWAEETPDGPMPVILQSVPMLVKKASGILTGPQLVK